jgi:hypothetical protein
MTLDVISKDLVLMVRIMTTVPPIEKMRRPMMIVERVILREYRRLFLSALVKACPPVFVWSWSPL